MTKSSNQDPYSNNILTTGLGQILTRQKILKSLSKFPIVPRNIHEIPVHIRLHYLMQVRDLHIASSEGVELFMTIDLMMRQSYRYRNPNDPSTWRNISGNTQSYVAPKSPAMVATGVGISGAGKTAAVHHSFNVYPSQVSTHKDFPNTVNGLTQVHWISTDAPSTGKSSDLAENLMTEWDRITGGRRFETSLSRSRRDGLPMLNEWRQVASSHFLGLLHLDEIQNFFKIPTLERRRKAKSADIDLSLSIVEDAILRWLISLTNVWQIPLLLTGTPDGIGALTKRFSTSQRIVTCGYHRISHFESPKDRAYYETFLRALFDYQYVSKKLVLTEEVAEKIFRLTAGIQRIIIILWIAAHRIAFKRKEDDLRIEDFEIAATKHLSILRPAIEAIHSKDPIRYGKFEDLMRRDDEFWSTFWNPNL
jgi:hypothetical protein